MSDDPTRDPVDEAYARAETRLDDDAARAARRARVMAAVSAEPARASPVARPLRRHGGWLAAAVVALGVFTAVRIREPDRPPPETAPAPKAAPAPTAPVPSMAEAARPSAPPIVEPAAQARPAAPPPVSPAPPPTSAAPDAPPPPPLPIPPLPAPTASAPVASADLVPPSLREEAAASRGRMAEEGRSIAPQQNAAAAFAPALRRAQPAARAASTPPAPGDLAARLRAAAAAGEVAEVEALLGKEVPIDAPDAAGETALMKAVRAARPAVVALLRKRGASVTRVNAAGETAANLAAARRDPALDRALGLRR